MERVSRLYEQGVDLIRIGAYVRRWQRWTGSGLRALGKELSGRAFEIVGRSLDGVGGPWPLPLLLPAATPSVGEPADRPDRR